MSPASFRIAARTSALGEEAYGQLVDLLERLLPVAEGGHETEPFANRSDHRPVGPVDGP